MPTGGLSPEGPPRCPLLPRRDLGTGDRDDPRLFPPLRRDDPDWTKLYRLRQSVERVFKSMKESRRLEQHCVRGLRQVALHAAMSALSHQATALAHLAGGETELIRWMVTKVA